MHALPLLRRHRSSDCCKRRWQAYLRQQLLPISERFLCPVDSAHEVSLGGRSRRRLGRPAARHLLGAASWGMGGCWRQACAPCLARDLGSCKCVRCRFDVGWWQHNRKHLKEALEKKDMSITLRLYHEPWTPGARAWASGVLASSQFLTRDGADIQVCLRRLVVSEGGGGTVREARTCPRVQRTRAACDAGAVPAGAVEGRGHHRRLHRRTGSQRRGYENAGTLSHQSTRVAGLRHPWMFSCI